MTTELHLVMHGVAIKKHGTAAEVAEVAGLPVERAGAVIAQAVEKGRLVEADGRYVLSPAGQMIVAGEYSRFCDELRANADFVAAYEQFETINTQLKQLITDWQTVEIGGKRVPNDHGDDAYDEEIIGKLGALHERFEPVLARLVAAVPRMRVYSDKLAAALEKAEDGEVAWVSDAKTESYHTVWFELHEDLLRVLGRERQE